MSFFPSNLSYRRRFFPCYQRPYPYTLKGNTMARPNYEFQKRQKELAKKKKKEEKKQRKQENKSVENDDAEKSPNS